MLNIPYGHASLVRTAVHDGGRGRRAGPASGAAPHTQGAPVHHCQDEEGGRGGGADQRLEICGDGC